MWIIRCTGPDEPLIWQGVGQYSIGIQEIPKNVPVRIKDFQYGAPAADGNYHNKNAGTKVETKVVKTKTVSEILNDIRREYHALTFKVFNSRDEALCGQTDFELLNVAPNASQQEIKDAYRSLSIIHHPDRSGDPVKFQQINSAYQRLKTK